MKQNKILHLSPPEGGDGLFLNPAHIAGIFEMQDSYSIVTVDGGEKIMNVTKDNHTRDILTKFFLREEAFGNPYMVFTHEHDSGIKEGDAYHLNMLNVTTVSARPIEGGKYKYLYWGMESEKPLELDDFAKTLGYIVKTYGFLWFTGVEYDLGDETVLGSALVNPALVTTWFVDKPNARLVIFTADDESALAVPDTQENRDVLYRAFDFV